MDDIAATQRILQYTKQEDIKYGGKTIPLFGGQYDPGPEPDSLILPYPYPNL